MNREPTPEGAGRDEQLRAALLPLAEGERPAALRVAIAVAALLAVGVIVGALTVARPLPPRRLAAGGGLPRRRAGAAGGRDVHRALLGGAGFEALLAFQIIVTSLALVVAATIARGLGLPGVIMLAAGCSRS